MSKQFDLEAFKAFVAGKPADEEYDFTNSSRCAVAQYQKLNGTYRGQLYSRELDDLHPGLLDALVGEETFGALSSRLEGVS